MVAGGVATVPEGDKSGVEYPDEAHGTALHCPRAGSHGRYSIAVRNAASHGAGVAGIGVTGAGVPGAGDIGAGNKLGGVVAWSPPLGIGVPCVIVGGCNGC